MKRFEVSILELTHAVFALFFWNYFILVYITTNLFLIEDSALFFPRL